MRIGLLEDDTDIVDVMTLWVEMAGDDIEAYTTGKSFREHAGKEQFDVIVLDWHLPDTNGLLELDWLRKEVGCTTPVIFITANDDEKSIVEALEHGADDYMVKPVYKEVALARIKALHLKEQRNAAKYSGDAGALKEEGGKSVEEYDPYKIDHARRRLSKNGMGILLSDKEFDVAAYLFENEARLVSHDELHKEVWGKRPGFNASTVDDHISSVQEKLEISEDIGWKLTTIYQCGYRLYKVRQY